MGRLDAESETLIPTTGGVFDVAHTLKGEGFDASEDGTGRGTPLVPVAFGCKDSDPARSVSSDVSPTLRAMGHTGSHANAGGQVAVAFQERGRAAGRELEIGGDVAYALTAPNGGGRSQERNSLTPDMAVRRLTPRECERLQGFPDDYTLIPWRTYQHAQRKGVSYESLLAERGMRFREPAGEECPDGPRYKALGNSMAVPVMRWIGERIEAVAAIAEAA